LLAWVLVTGAPASGATPEDVVLLVAAGQVRVRVAEWTELSVVGSDWAAARLDDATLALLEREAARAFAPEELLGGISTGLGGASASEVAAVRAFVATPLGRRTLGVDRTHLPVESLRRMPEDQSGRLLDGLEGPRWDALRRLDAATGMTRDTAITSTGLGVAIGSGAWKLACRPPERWPAAASRLEQRIGALYRYVEPAVAAAIDARYHDLPTSDLARLAHFAETDGAWLYQRIGESLRAALARSGQDLLTRLAPEITDRCAGAPRASH
jgi:hypothetical protein